MSFLKKLAKEFDDLATKVGGSKTHEHPETRHGAPHSDAPTIPSPAHDPANPAPPPPGWLVQFDSSAQRWFYVEQATGRTQWDPPAAPLAYGAPHGAAHDYYHSPGHGMPPGAGGYAAHGYPPHGGGVYEHEKEKKSGGKGGLAMMGAAGVGLGAAGLVAGHALGKT